MKPGEYRLLRKRIEELHTKVDALERKLQDEGILPYNLEEIHP